MQARTLELYRQLDLADAVVARGHKVAAVNLWAKGEPAARMPFETIGAGLTPYSFLQIFPQDEHERLLIERLRALGVAVERQTELVRLTDERGGVIARLRRPDGDEAIARRATSPAATAPARWCARRSAPDFRAAPIGRFSMSPTSRLPALR